jgi:hypothetical protein
MVNAGPEGRRRQPTLSPFGVPKILCLMQSILRGV